MFRVIRNFQNGYLTADDYFADPQTVYYLDKTNRTTLMWSELTLWRKRKQLKSGTPSDTYR